MKRTGNKGTGSESESTLTRSVGLTRAHGEKASSSPLVPSNVCSLQNSYQRNKAKRIAAVLILAAAASDTPMSQLALLASRMDQRQWITVSLQAGVPVAEHSARVLVVAMLHGLA